MKLLFDFFPIILFFIAYKIYGIYVATAVAMAASLLQVGAYWFKHRKFESMHLITLIMVVLLGGATLILHNVMFIKWKPTTIYWAFGFGFLFSQFIGKKPLIQRLMDSKIVVTDSIWQRLNLVWTIFFFALGIANLFVVYNFSTDIWVDFKLFGTLGLTLVFVLLQAIYIARHMDTNHLKEMEKQHS